MSNTLQHYQVRERIRVMVFNATFNNISVISCMVVSFIGGGNRSIRKKTTDLPQDTDKLYHILLD